MIVYSTNLPAHANIYSCKKSYCIDFHLSYLSAKNQDEFSFSVLISNSVWKKVFNCRSSSPGRGPDHSHLIVIVQKNIRFVQSVAKCFVLTSAATNGERRTANDSLLLSRNWTTAKKEKLLITNSKWMFELWLSLDCFCDKNLFLVLQKLFVPRLLLGRFV